MNIRLAQNVSLRGVGGGIRIHANGGRHDRAARVPHDRPVNLPRYAYRF